MEPRIHYAKTSDGVNIAFWTLGEGTPIIDMAPTPFSHIQLEWQQPHLVLWNEGVAAGHQLVHFDPRGCGLSDRQVTDYSLQAFSSDVDAVTSVLGLEEFCCAELRARVSSQSTTL